MNRAASFAFDSHGAGASRTGLLAQLNTRTALYSISLFMLVAFIIITIRYAAASSALDRAALTDPLVEGASGDKGRQVFYFAVFFIIAWFTVVTSKPVAWIPISIPYNLACVWCLISFIWAIEPGIAFRRALGMYIILLAVAWCIQNLGAARSLRMIYLLLAAVLIASFVSVALSKLPLFSFAVHPDDEIDESLIGGWKGVFLHKNVAGAVMVHSAIFFFHHAINMKRKADWLFFFMSLIFLYFTKSKTALGWCALVLASGLLFRFMAIRKAQWVFTVIFLAIVAFVGVFAVALWDQVTAFLTNPENLTGRVGIWMSLAPFIEQHPLLGSGYGSFWAIGFVSPIFELARADYVAVMGHSHNGYIEVLLTTGLVGFSLAMISLLIVPFYRFVTTIHEDARLAAMLFSIWLFGILQNLTEAQFFAADKQSWIFVVIAITITHNRYILLRKGMIERLGATAWPKPLVPAYGRPVEPPVNLAALRS
jgi:O-antigen ligase